MSNSYTLIKDFYDVNKNKIKSITDKFTSKILNQYRKLKSKLGIDFNDSILSDSKFKELIQRPEKFKNYISEKLGVPVEDINYVKSVLLRAKKGELTIRDAIKIAWHKFTFYFKQKKFIEAFTKLVLDFGYALSGVYLVFLVNTFLYACIFGLLILVFGYRPADAMYGNIALFLTSIFVAPITEEIFKMFYAKTNNTVMSQIVFNFAEFTDYVLRFANTGINILTLILVRILVVLMHVFNSLRAELSQLYRKVGNSEKAKKMYIANKFTHFINNLIGGPLYSWVYSTLGKTFEKLSYIITWIILMWVGRKKEK